MVEIDGLWIDFHSSKLADLTIVTSDNPRDEKPEDILADIVTGVEKADGKYITIINREEAIRYAIEHAEEGRQCGQGALHNQLFIEQNIEK